MAQAWCQPPYKVIRITGGDERHWNFSRLPRLYIIIPGMDWRLSLADGWKDRMMTKGMRRWMGWHSGGEMVPNLSLKLSLMDGWMKRGDGGVVMKTGELRMSACPLVSFGSALKRLIEWVKNLFGSPLSSWLLQQDGVVNDPSWVLHNLPLVLIECQFLEGLLSLGCLCASPCCFSILSSVILSSSLFSLVF